jgi:hypothetical protein
MPGEDHCHWIHTKSYCTVKQTEMDRVDCHTTPIWGKTDRYRSSVDRQKRHSRNVFTLWSSGLWHCTLILCGGYQCQPRTILPPYFGGWMTLKTTFWTHTTVNVNVIGCTTFLGTRTLECEDNCYKNCVTVWKTGLNKQNRQRMYNMTLFA